MTDICFNPITLVCINFMSFTLGRLYAAAKYNRQLKTLSSQMENDLKRGHAVLADLCKAVEFRKEIEGMTEAEKKFMALSLHTMAMRSGPPFFDIAANIAAKLEIEKQLIEYSQNWIQYSKDQKSNNKNSTT